MINVRFKKNSYFEVKGVCVTDDNGLRLVFSPNDVVKCTIKKDHDAQKVFDLIWQEVDCGSRTIDISEYVENSYAP